MEKRWRLNSNTDVSEINKISEEAGINKFIAAILYNRGIKASDEAIKFLNPKLKLLHSPKYMKDMDKGTDITINAIKENKKIVIYGDYDCDGVTSTAIMLKGLLKCGADVSYHVPDRIEEGYGMNSERVKKLAENGCQLIITCDNGISCIEQVALAKTLGMEIVVTDHHEVPFNINENGNKEEMLPQADAVINPKRQGCEYPFKFLCGAGIAFKFIHTIYHKLGIDTKQLYELIELAAIGTVCDVVDLCDENRVIVSMGLKMINETKNIGLKALIKEIGYEEKKVKAGNLGFQIGPCINATGRLDTARLSVELLMCKDETKVADLAKELRNLNVERQELTDKALEQVMDQIERTDLKNDRVLVVYKEDLHESLAGIVAGRIREKYNRPAYVITKAKDTAKGSGRSIEEYNMFEELCKCKDLLIGAGGHPMAAGFSLSEENIPLFRIRLNEICTLEEEDLIYKIDVDNILELSNIDLNLTQELEKIEPFGKGNKEPLFMIENLNVDRIFIMGKNKDSFKLSCRDVRTNGTIQAVHFFGVDGLKQLISETYGEDMIERIIENPLSVNLKMDLLFKPSVNEWNNTKSVQLMIVDYKILGTR